jgi:hypothetical protein
MIRACGVMVVGAICMLAVIAPRPSAAVTPKNTAASFQLVKRVFVVGGARLCLGGAL